MKLRLFSNWHFYTKFVRFLLKNGKLKQNLKSVDSSVKFRHFFSKSINYGQSDYFLFEIKKHKLDRVKNYLVLTINASKIGEKKLKWVFQKFKSVVKYQIVKKREKFTFMMFTVIRYESYPIHWILFRMVSGSRDTDSGILFCRLERFFPPKLFFRPKNFFGPKWFFQAINIFCAKMIRSAKKYFLRQNDSFGKKYFFLKMIRSAKKFFFGPKNDSFGHKKFFFAQKRILSAKKFIGRCIGPEVKFWYGPKITLDQNNCPHLR